MFNNAIQDIIMVVEEKVAIAFLEYEDIEAIWTTH